MNNWIEKLLKSLALISLLFLVSSCEPGCVEPYEFDTEMDTVNAKPTSDGIDTGGGYNPTTGGEKANWHDTGVRIDGNQMVISIGGSWSSWDDAVNNEQLKALSACNICFKKAGVANCLCPSGVNPAAEKDAQGNTRTDVNCSGNDQNDATKCTCTKQSGVITDPDVYMIALDYQEKNETLKHQSKQEPCRWEKGAGLYLGLFGSNSNTVPIRAYHLYSTEELCNIKRDAQNRCVDSAGTDVTRYVFRSANNKTFVKDIVDGRPVYHEAGEKLKLIINDRYYSDNYGFYSIEFLSGIIKTADKGLLSLIVGTIEDGVLGKISPTTGRRQGGAVEFMYKSIVQDSGFKLFLQVCLVAYVTAFGVGVLAGIVEISRKEMTQRILKLSLILLFTTSASWSIYNQFVIGFFKDGMDSIIAMFMNMTDRNFDTTSMIKVAQIDNANTLSNATRFSYIDFTIKKLLSFSVTKKIWGLFFGVWFGVLYIPLIYALIFFFIYVMLTAAFVYISSMMKLVFVLALGPIFIITSLFSKTEGTFKKWISFMGARTIEVIALFVMLYTFLIMIDNGFNDLLYLRSCTKAWSLGFFHIDVIETTSDRNFIGWISAIIKIGALIFMLKLIMEKIPGFAAALVAYGGESASSAGANAGAYAGAVNKSAFGMAGSAMGQIMSVGKAAATQWAPTAARGLIEGAGMVARATGADAKIDGMREAIPFRSPVTVARDRFMIDSVINQKQKEAASKGLTGKKADEYVRRETMNAVGKQKTGDNKMVDNKNQRAIFGLDAQAISRRLDAKLIDEPMEKFIKSKIENMSKGKGEMLFGDDLKRQLRTDVAAWAKDNIVASTADALERFDSSKFQSLISKKGELSTSDAARLFAGNEEMQSKYMQHLSDMKYKKEAEKSKAQSKWFGETRNALKTGAETLTRNTAYNPKIAMENFQRKVHYEEQKQKQKGATPNYKDMNLPQRLAFKAKEGFLETAGLNTAKGLSVVQRVNVLDKALNKATTKALTPGTPPSRDMPFSIEEKTRQAERKAMTDFLASGYKKEFESIAASYDADVKKKSETLTDTHKAALEAKGITLSKGKADDLKKGREKELKEKMEKFHLKLIEMAKEDAEKSAKNLEELRRLETQNPSYKEQREKMEEKLNEELAKGEKLKEEISNNFVSEALRVLKEDDRAKLEALNKKGLRDYTTAGEEKVTKDEVEEKTKILEDALKQGKSLRTTPVDPDKKAKRDTTEQLVEDKLEAMASGEKFDSGNLQASFKSDQKKISREKAAFEQEYQSLEREIKNLEASTLPQDQERLKELRSKLQEVGSNISHANQTNEAIKDLLNKLK